MRALVQEPWNTEERSQTRALGLCVAQTKRLKMVNLGNRTFQPDTQCPVGLLYGIFQLFKLVYWYEKGRCPKETDEIYPIRCIAFKKESL